MGSTAGIVFVTGDGTADATMTLRAPFATLNTALQSMSRERLLSLIKAFLEETPVTLDRLRAAVRDGQPLDLRVNAHAARGAALNLGFTAVAATAEALHQGASHLPAHEIALLVQRFEDQLAMSCDALQRLGLMPDMHVTR